MKDWQPVDIIITIFATVISVVLLLIIIDATLNNDALSDASSKRISAITTSVVAIISMYIGAKIQEHKDNNDGRK